MKVEKEYNFLDISRLLPWLLLVFFVVCSYLVFLVYRSYMIAFFGAILFYIIFRQPHYWLLDKLGQRRNLAATLSTVAVILAVFIPLTYVLFSLGKEVAVAITKLKDLLTEENLILLYEKNRWIDKYIHIAPEDLAKVEAQIISLSQDIGYYTLKQGGSLLAMLASLASNFIFTMFILFFLFRGGDQIGPIIYRALPWPDEMEEEFGTRMVSVLDAILKGNMMVSMFQGIIVGLLFWIFDLPTPILYGTLATFFSLIPVIGTMIVWGPAAVYLYFESGIVPAVLLGAFAMGFYLLLENLLKPWILDRKLNLHPLFLFLAILGGLTEFGIKGLILGPFFVITFLSLYELYALWNEKYGSQSTIG